MAGAGAEHREGKEGWQPIETAPLEGEPLILFARHISASTPIPMIGFHHPEMGWIAQSFIGQVPAKIVPSHWMPRPDFPKERAP